MAMFNLFKKSDTFLPRLNLLDWTVLIAGLAVYGGLAASTITKFSIWFDEAFGSYLIRFGFIDLTRYTASDVHPPLYYWLLKVWASLFGNTELGIRTMSLFFGVVTIVFAFLLVIRLFGRKAAYLSLLFLALSPMFIRYGQEARMYTLLTAIILAATYVLVYMTEHSKKRWPWIVYGVLVALGMLTQYFAALAWLSHWVWRYITVRRSGEPLEATRKRFFTKQWIGAHVVAIVLFLPWLPWFVWQFANIQGNGFWIPAVNSATVPDFLTNLLLFTSHANVQSWLAFAFYAILIVSTYICSRVIMQLKDQKKDHYLLLVCMVVVPVILLVVLSMPPLRSAFIDRYLMATIVFAPLLLGVSNMTVKNVKRWLLIGFSIVVIVLFGFGIVKQMQIGNFNKTTFQSNNTRQLLEKVRASDHTGEPIIANTPWIYYEAAIYSTNDSPIYFANEATNYRYGSLTMLAESDTGKIKDLDQFTTEHKSFWVISNLRDTAPNKLRSSWNIDETITVNDDVFNTPLFRAIHVTVE
jgi:mannosyltransferase